MDGLLSFNIIYSKGYNTWSSSMFNAFQVQFSLIQNGITQSSVTI